MKGEEEGVLLPGEADERRAEKRPAREIERTLGLGRGETPELGAAPRLRERREVDLPEPVARAGRRDDLDRFAFDIGDIGESGAERLVAPHDLAERGGQCGDI